MIGGLLAAFIVYCFLRNLRSTFIAAVAIPASVIGAFGAMAALDFTLNQMTMLALTLMVGIVIDDAIVVLENIYRFVEEKRLDPFKAAVEGHARDRSGGHGDDALAAGRVRAGGLHGRDGRPLHVVVRPHRVGGHRHQPAGVVHTDADAGRPLDQAAAGGPAARRVARPASTATSTGRTRGCSAGRWRIAASSPRRA